MAVHLSQTAVSQSPCKVQGQERAEFEFKNETIQISAYFSILKTKDLSQFFKVVPPWVSNLQKSKPGSFPTGKISF